MASESVRVLYFGDIVGPPGWRAVKQLAPVLRAKHGADLVIANAENASNGTGLTPELYRKLREAGVDGMTLGDHAFKKNQILPTLESATDLCRPANLSGQAQGRGWMRLAPGRADAPPVYVVPVLGRIYMGLPANDPFACVDHMISHLPEREAFVIVEVHAEATSEKVAMAWHLNGRAAAVLGTHTHVQTADARLLPADPHAPDPGPPASGTAYITDLGMTGPQSSVLGRRVDRVLKQMTTSMPAAFDVADHDAQVQGVLLELDPATKHATRIEPIRERVDLSQPPFSA